MTNETKIKILNVARYIVNNKATISIAAQHFNVTTSSIKKYINDKDKLQAIDYKLYEDVKKVQKGLEEIGHYVGGKNGQREPKYTDFEAMEVAETMINEKLTIKEASKKFNIPSSSLYDIIRRIKDDLIQKKLDDLFEENKRI